MFEYMTMSIGGAPENAGPESKAPHILALNAVGVEGWILCSTVQLKEGGIYCVFVRQKSWTRSRF